MSVEKLQVRAMSIMKVLRRIWRVLVLSVNKYIETDAELRAASFAYYAFFALFPLFLLLISLGSRISANRQEVVDSVLEFMGQYFPEGQNLIISTLQGVQENWTTAGVVAILALLWSSLRFFQALLQGVNRAWGTREYSWWRLPLANLLMVGILASTLLLGVLAPVVMKAVEEVLKLYSRGVGLEMVVLSFKLARLIIPSVVLFYGLIMFYKYAPHRKTTLGEVWMAAAFVTIFLQLLQKGFVTYADNFAKFNLLYGALGSVVAVLMWIYLSGSVIIFGGCLCAAQSEVKEEDKGTSTQ